MQRVTDRLLRKSAYLRPPADGLIKIDDKTVEAVRRMLGGNLSGRPYQIIRWIAKDREEAIHDADAGNLEKAAQLWRAILTDGTFAGALSTRTAGTVSLPRKFYGNDQMIRELELGHESVRSVFDEMLPPGELTALLEDRIGLGVGIGELCPVEGRDYPVLRRLDPMFLRYRWNEGRWYYNTNAGPIPVVPGDGHWCLFTAGTAAPWQRGIWQYASQAWIRKMHAVYYSQSFEQTLANPARVCTAPLGATEEDRAQWFAAAGSWDNETIFLGIPGYDIKLLESQGTGWQVFQKTIAACNDELLMAANGQTVTATGGSGFISSDLFRSVRQELIKEAADDLAYFINVQCIPQWVARKYGPELIDYGPCVVLDSRPPKDQNAAAASMMASANAITALAQTLQPFGLQVDIQAAIAQFGLPVLPPAEESEYEIPITVQLEGDILDTNGSTPAEPSDTGADSGD